MAAAVCSHVSLSLTGAGRVDCAQGARVSSTQDHAFAPLKLRQARLQTPLEAGRLQLRCARTRQLSVAAKSMSSSFAVQAQAESAPTGRIIKGKCFVVEDNIDTDQIIPAEYLTLVPSKPDEYEKLGSYAMVGLPKHYPRYIEEGKMKTEYPIMIGGNNFGCGSSREHAPVAMGASGCRTVVAPSFARIFFRNCVATGELYPVESETRLCSEFDTGDVVTVDMEHDILINHTKNKQFTLKPIGEAGPVIDAGGIFNYARQTGMIAAKA